MEFTDEEKVMLLSALSTRMALDEDALQRNPLIIDVAEKRLKIMETLIQKITATVEA